MFYHHFDIAMQIPARVRIDVPIAAGQNPAAVLRVSGFAADCVILRVNLVYICIIQASGIQI